MAGQGHAEARCCWKRARSHKANVDAATQLVHQQGSAARASREVTAASQPDALAPVFRQRGSHSSGEGGYSGASADQEELWTITGAPAATLRPAAREEPQPRALLPAPLRPRAASASVSHQRSQSDAMAQMQTPDRRQPELGHAGHSDSGVFHDRLQPRDQSRRSSDRSAWEPPAAKAAGRVSRQGSVGGVGDVDALAGLIDHARSPRGAECSHPGHSGSRTANDPDAVAAENAALHEALRSSEQALAAAQDAAQRSAARYEAAIEQLADAQRAARADAERADVQMQQLTEELARCASVLQRPGLSLPYNLSVWGTIFLSE